MPTQAGRPRVASLRLAPFRVGSAVAGVLPGRMGRAVAEAAGVAAARVGLDGHPVAIRGSTVARGLRRRRALVASHLRRIYGPSMPAAELAARVDDTFASYARYWAESLRLPSLGAAEVDAGMSLWGFEHLEVAVAAGRGVVLALPHLGGWDWGGAFLAGSGHRVSVVVEALEPPEVFEWFAGFRRRLGLEVIAVGPGAGAACLRALGEGRILCLLSDRVVGGAASVPASMFGAPVRLPAGPVTLALRSGAALLPAAVYFGSGPDDHLAVVRPRLALERSGRLRDDVAEGTRRLAGELEGLIRRAPTQWHVMSPTWAGDEDLAAAGSRLTP